MYKKNLIKWRQAQFIFPKLLLMLLLIGSTIKKVSVAETFSAFTTQVQPILTNTSYASDSTKQKPKNVLFIVVDDLRPNLRSYGDTIAITPNIDRLASRGTTFSNAYCQQSVCAPSRASVLTGTRPNTTKVWDLKTHFRTALPDIVTLPQYFKIHGYYTQSVGKIYHDPKEAQDPISWTSPEILAVTDEIGGRYALAENLEIMANRAINKAHATERAPVADSVYIDGQVGNEAVRMLNKIKDKPFFLAVGFRRPHLPFVAPEKYWAMYDGVKLPKPSPAHAPENVPDIALHNWVELRTYTGMPAHGSINDPQRIQNLLQGYYASTSFTDAQIGRVLDELDRLGLTDNTIVVLWGDHGFHLGEHGLWAKTTNFELDTRVPLIVSAPGQKKKNIISPALVELVDMYPTLTELADLPTPNHLEGYSMVPLLAEPNKPWKKGAFSQFLRKDGQRQIMGYSVRTREFRYTEWRDHHSGDLLEAELYDHINDPEESVNIINQNGNKETIITLSEILNQGWKKVLPTN
ncbi:MAG: sulfatase [Sphingobacterium sp.]